jgi:hypothetical protein
MHYWSANLLIAVVLLHVVRVVLTGGYHLCLPRTPSGPFLRRLCRLLTRLIWFADFRFDHQNRNWYVQDMNSHIDTTLEKFVDHLTRGFTLELAKHFAELPEPDPEFQVRLDELADKANEGKLSAAESREYDKYIEYMDFVALMRLKARARVAGSPIS